MNRPDDVKDYERITRWQNRRDTAGAILGGVGVGLGIDLDLAAVALGSMAVVFACLTLLATRNG